MKALWDISSAVPFDLMYCDFMPVEDTERIRNLYFMAMLIKNFRIKPVIYQLYTLEKYDIYR